MLVVVAQEKSQNPDITDEQIAYLNTHYDLVDEMVCYCQQRTASGIYVWNLFNIDWADYDPNGVDANNYCMTWEWNSIVAGVVSTLSSTSMIVLNAIIATLFARLSKFKKKHTTIEEQSTGFSQIFFMEFFNMGLIMLLLSFDPSGTSQTMAGQEEPMIYRGFETAWYEVLGKKLCLTLFMSTFATNVGEIKKIGQAGILRLKDRGGLPNIKKDLEDEDDDEVNTKIYVQDEVEALYRGGAFEGEKTFSRMMSTLLVITTYSSGMPILYLVGAFFFSATYIVNKVVIFQYYQRSLTLNRVVPNYSM
jgi:hypothetical protein